MYYKQYVQAQLYINSLPTSVSNLSIHSSRNKRRNTELNVSAKENVFPLILMAKYLNKSWIFFYIMTSCVSCACWLVQRNTNTWQVNREHTSTFLFVAQHEQTHKHTPLSFFSSNVMRCWVTTSTHHGVQWETCYIMWYIKQLESCTLLLFSCCHCESILSFSQGHCSTALPFFNSFL